MTSTAQFQASGSMSSGVEMTPTPACVSSSIDTLAQRCGSLHKAVAMLSERLTAVLRASEPSAVEERKEQDQPSSDLRCQIDSNSGAVLSAIESIEGIAARLDL